MIATTTNIDINIYSALLQESAKSGIAMRDIVHVLLKIMLREKPLNIDVFKRIKYQERIEGRVWKKFHIELSEGSYEACLDLRKLMKMSVSFILSIAVELYLDRVMNELKRRRSTDNYPEFYLISITHSPLLSTFTAFHTLPNPIDIPNYNKEHYSQNIY